MHILVTHTCQNYLDVTVGKFRNYQRIIISVQTNVKCKYCTIMLTAADAGCGMFQTGYH